MTHIGSLKGEGPIDRFQNESRSFPVRATFIFVDLLEFDIDLELFYASFVLIQSCTHL